MAPTQAGIGVAVALLADPGPAILAATGMRSQSQPEPSGDLRAERKRLASGTFAAITLAVIGPMPGMVAAGGVGSMPVQDPALEVIHLLRQAFGVVDQGADWGNSAVRQAVSGGAKLGFQLWPVPRRNAHPASKQPFHIR